MKKPSTAAQVAKWIKHDLKYYLRDTKFSVRSNGYDTVRISWKNGESRDEIKNIVYKYKIGRDGMKRDDLPQVEYIFFERTLSEYFEIKLVEAFDNQYIVADENLRNQKIEQIRQKNISEIEKLIDGQKIGLFR